MTCHVSSYLSFNGEPRGDSTTTCTTSSSDFSATADAALDFAKTVAQSFGASLHLLHVIVMGTHGRTGMAHLFTGSVAERVVRLAACPVLTVRADKTVFKQPQRAYLPEMPTQIPA